MENIIKWINGNPLQLAIPLQKVTITESGKVVEPYIPQADERLVVVLTEKHAYWNKLEYTPTSITDNIVTIKDEGTLPVGVYDITILVYEAQTEILKRRSKWTHQIEIYDDNAQVLDEFDDFPDYGSGEVVDAAIFFFAKGDKGDKGDKGRDGYILYPVFDVDANMHLTSDEGIDRMEINNEGHLTVDY